MERLITSKTIINQNPGDDEKVDVGLVKFLAAMMKDGWEGQSITIDNKAHIIMHRKSAATPRS